MARLIERAFNPTEPVVARRFFVAAGRHFNPGDAFDWRRLAVAQRRVKQLFDNGKLMHPPAWAEAEVGGVGALRTPEPASEPATEFAVDLAEILAPPIEQEVENAAILATAAAPTDDLDGMNMKELRAVALAEGAPTRLRREDQREAIREHRRGQD